MPRFDMRTIHRVIVAELYSRTSSPVDDLRFTDEFNRPHAEFESRGGRTMSKHDYWRALSNAREAR